MTEENTKNSSCRVLILTDRFPPNDRGGAERIAYYHAHGLKDKGYEVAVFTSQADGVPMQSAGVIEDGIRVFRSFSIYSGSSTSRRTFADKLVHFPLMILNPLMEKRLSDIIEKFRPNIIHAHHIPRISYGAFSRAAPANPHILTFHGYQYECPKGGLRRRQGHICNNRPVLCSAFAKLMTKTIHGVDRIIAISHFIQHRLINSGYEPSRIVYIPNGVFSLETKELMPPAKEKQVLYVGRVAENKGIRELIQAFFGIPNSDARLVIVGDGAFLPYLRSLAGNDNRIEFAGWQRPEDVARLYQQSRLVVVPSLWHEVMNTVICEAQSWSRPVVATRVGGNDDLIEDGISGYLCRPGDVAGLRSVIKNLLEDYGLAQQMGEAGFQHVKRYTMNRHIESIQKLYRQFGCR